jgi:hypothetical protein
MHIVRNNDKIELICKLTSTAVIMNSPITHFIIFSIIMGVSNMFCDMESPRLPMWLAKPEAHWYWISLSLTSTLSARRSERSDISLPIQPNNKALGSFIECTAPHQRFCYILY